MLGGQEPHGVGSSRSCYDSSVARDAKRTCASEPPARLNDGRSLVFVPMKRIIRVASIALLGLAVLLISVIREKLFVRKTDPYKEIQR